MAVYISSRVPEVLIGDPGRLRQVITNLVGNSVKFTEKGHIFVSVHLAEEMKRLCVVENHIFRQRSDLVENGIDLLHDTLSGFRVVDRCKSWENFRMFESDIEATDAINILVTVEDTGVGIPEDAQNHIFMPFMQADSSTSRTYGGTGIGLSISKCLVDLMGGEIGFVSEPGVGSSFSFTAVFREGWKNSVDVKRQQSEITVSDFRGMRGLVIDGRRIRAVVTEYHLQRLGLEVEVATNPKSALSKILDACSPGGTGHVDMVLVDKDAWGEGSGLAFARPIIELKQNGRLKPHENIPKMVLLSTSLTPSEVDDIKSVGYIDSIIKPLRLSMMTACLQRALGVGDKRHQEAGRPPTLKSLLSGKQILVVDDNLVNLKVAAGALKKYGAVVKCADSGKAAIELLQPPHKFDACFMDVQMPEMDGFEATRRIRDMEQKVNKLIESREASAEMYGNVAHWHLPILAMTADVFQANYDECVRYGMDGYVSKPFEVEQLYSAVAQFFESDEAAVVS